MTEPIRKRPAHAGADGRHFSVYLLQGIARSSRLELGRQSRCTTIKSVDFMSETVAISPTEFK